MNQNDIKTRFENLEKQVFGMTHDKWIEMRQKVGISNDVIIEFIKAISFFDPKGSRYLYRIRIIQAQFGFTDNQLLSVIQSIKAHYDGRKPIFDSHDSPAMIDYPSLAKPIFDDLIINLKSTDLKKQLVKLQNDVDSLMKKENERA